MMSSPFLALVGAFLVVSGVMLYLLRQRLARVGKDGWSWLPETTKFKSHEYQLRASKVAAYLVAMTGFGFLAISFMP